MTDRELLELAARAAGITITRCRLDDLLMRDMLVTASERNRHQMAGPWNPLTDDGDALRLAVKLEVTAGYSDFSGEGVATWSRGYYCVKEYGPDDPCAATRRAIVRAAAEIGKAMP